MVVLGAVIISLACAFLGYCLLHFRRELRQSRNRRTSYGLSPMGFRGTARDIEIPGPAIALQMPQAIRSIAQAHLSSKRTDMAAAALGKAKVLTYPNGHTTVSESRPGRANKSRAIKG